MAASLSYFNDCVGASGKIYHEWTDCSSLSGDRWITCDVMAAFAKLLQNQRDCLGKKVVIVESSHVWMTRFGWESAHQLYPFDLSAADVWALEVNVTNSHWIGAAVIAVLTKTVYFFDGFGRAQDHRCLIREVLEFFKEKNERRLKRIALEDGNVGGANDEDQSVWKRVYNPVWQARQHDSHNYGGVNIH